MLWKLVWRWLFGASHERALFAWVFRGAFWVAAAILLFVIAVGVLGGLRLDGRYLDWTAVAALGSMATALAALGALGAAGNAANELLVRSRDERILRKPYLRVDLGFAETEQNHPGFRPPTPDHWFTAHDFGIEESLRSLDGLRPRNTESQLATLAVRVTNLQDRPLAVCFNIHLYVDVSWSVAGRQSGSSLDIEFAYVGATQTTGLAVAHVRTDVDWLFAEVAAVGYEDIFGSEILSDHHGALLFSYDAIEGARHERRFRLTR